MCVANKLSSYDQRFSAKNTVSTVCHVDRYGIEVVTDLVICTCFHVFQCELTHVHYFKIETIQSDFEEHQEISPGYPTMTTRLGYFFPRLKNLSLSTRRRRVINSFIRTIPLDRSAGRFMTVEYIYIRFKLARRS